MSANEITTDEHAWPQIMSVMSTNCGVSVFVIPMADATVIGEISYCGYDQPGVQQLSATTNGWLGCLIMVN